MVFHDWGLLHFEEPFTRFFAHAHITKDGAKMSKSKGNIVTVDDYVRPYGVDAGRMYLMFLGPFDKGGDFRDAGIRGITRFLERVWRFVNEGRGQRAKGKGSDDVDRIVHRAIRKVTGDIEELQYNTAISALMVLLNAFEEQPEAVSADQVSVFLRLLAPFAPHMAEELWREALGEKGSIHRSPWPQTDLRYLKAERQTLVIQVNGKVRDRVEVEAGAGEAGVREMVLAREKVRQWIRGKPVKKFIYIPGRSMNVVV
jgi:leucyl-tRNA synthetase